jgi:NO-binding membrane sensor protein with MHYT domain/two-component sensor histidine kinase
MVGTYDYLLVLLSVVVAIAASFVALDLAARVSASSQHRTRAYWLAAGALSMGGGIWSMHFIGMLAFRLPISVSYDIPITLASLLIAITASWFALWVAGRETLSPRRLAAAGFLMGFAIVSMHYVGMAAMRMQPPITYRPVLVALSIAIAIAASLIALWRAFKQRAQTVLSAFWNRAGSAVAMGLAIVGMHYTGMAAARFDPNSVCTVSPPVLHPYALAAAVGASTLLFLLATLLVSAYDDYRATFLQTRVEQASGEVARLSARLVAMHDEERRNLAAELHDVIGQDLAAANADLALVMGQMPAVAPPALSERLQDASALLKRSVEALRSVMVQLYPPGLNELGIAAALRSHGEAFESRTGIPVSVQVDEALARPSQPVSDALLRIYLEALGNVSKHAEASDVTTVLERRGSQIVMSISDDGRGFDAKRPVKRDDKSGWGLMIMQERARSIAADLRLESAPGTGTRIELRMPEEKWS